MSLWLDLNINANIHVGRMEIMRQEFYDGDPPDDSVNTYVVMVDGKNMGMVRHRYGNGAWGLLAKAALLADLVLKGEAMEPAPGWLLTRENPPQLEDHQGHEAGG